MPSNIIYSAKAVPPIRAVDNSLDTRDGYRDGVPPVVTSPNVVFDPQIESMPNWQQLSDGQSLLYPTQVTSDDAHLNVPEPFDVYYQKDRENEWGTTLYPPNPNKKPAGEITDIIPGPFPGDKSYLIWDESWGSGSQWGTDAQLGKQLVSDISLEQNYMQLHTQFYFQLQPGWQWHSVIPDAQLPWLNSGQGYSEIKVFRINHTAPEIEFDSRFKFFGADMRAKSPEYMLKIKSETENDIMQLNPQMYGYTPYEYINDDANKYIGIDAYREQKYVYQGTATRKTTAELLIGKWCKIDIFVSMNTPGVENGIIKIWINDILEHEQYNVLWKRAGEGANIGFNWMSIGGNAFNIPYDPTGPDLHEQWWGVSRLKMWDRTPF